MTDDQVQGADARATSEVERLTPLFLATPRDWTAIGEGLARAKAAGEQAKGTQLLAYAQHLEAAGELEKAWTAAVDSTWSTKTRDEGWRCASRVAMGLHDVSRLGQVIRAQLELSPSNGRILRAAIKEVEAWGGREAAIALLRETADVIPSEDRVRFKSYTEDVPELDEDLVDWARNLPASASPSESLKAIQLLVERGVEVPRQLDQNVLENEDTEMRAGARMRSLLRIYDHAGQRERALDVYRYFADSGARSRLVRFLPYAREVPGLAEELLDWAKSVTADARPGQRKTAMKIFTFHGLTPPPELAANEDDNEQYQKAWSLWGEQLPGDDELKRPVLQNYNSEEIFVSKATRPAPTLVVFSGLSDNFALPPPAFDRFLAALDVSGIYMSDKNRLGFSTGSTQLGTNFDETVEALRKMAVELETTRLVVLGTSAGGFSAMLYGLNLQAHSVLAFASVTNATPEFLAGDPRGRLVAKRAARIVEPRNLDVRPMISAPGNKTDIHLWYGADTTHDTRNAKHLEGMPRVHLHPVPDFGDHQVMRELARRGEFMDILRKALFD